MMDFFYTMKITINFGLFFFLALLEKNILLLLVAIYV